MELIKREEPQKLLSAPHLPYHASAALHWYRPLLVVDSVDAFIARLLFAPPLPSAFGTPLARLTRLLTAKKSDPTVIRSG